MLAGIGHAVHAADRQIDRFVLVHEHDLAAARHLRRALDDDPVFGAMEVLLQRQPLAGLHDDALDLIARAMIDRLVIAPGPVRALVLAAPRGGPPPSAVSTSFLTLSPCSRFSTSTASSVVTTTTSSTPTTVVRWSGERTCTFVASMTTPSPRIELPSRVALRQFPHRVPIADVRPADVGRHHRRLAGALHDGVVDRVLRRRG